MITKPIDVHPLSPRLVRFFFCISTGSNRCPCILAEMAANWLAVLPGLRDDAAGINFWNTIAHQDVIHV